MVARAEPDPAQPTMYRPGSEGKVDIMSRRYAKGLPLYHPQDRRNYENGIGDVVSESDPLEPITDIEDNEDFGEEFDDLEDGEESLPVLEILSRLSQYVDRPSKFSSSPPLFEENIRALKEGRVLQ